MLAFLLFIFTTCLYSAAFDNCIDRKHNSVCVCIMVDWGYTRLRCAAIGLVILLYNVDNNRRATLAFQRWGGADKGTRCNGFPFIWIIRRQDLRSWWWTTQVEMTILTHLLIIRTIVNGYAHPTANTHSNPLHKSSQTDWDPVFWSSPFCKSFVFGFRDIVYSRLVAAIQTTAHKQNKNLEKRPRTGKAHILSRAVGNIGPIRFKAYVWVPKRRHNRTSSILKKTCVRKIVRLMAELTGIHIQFLMTRASN